MSDRPARLGYEPFKQTVATTYEALRAASLSVGAAGLDKGLTELVKVRVSQINGCAFCLHMHLDLARRNQVPAEKLDLVAAWRETRLFTPRERAALAWAEALTALGTEAAPDSLYETVRAHFDETETALLTVAIGIINQWNRIAIGLGFVPE